MALVSHGKKGNSSVKLRNGVDSVSYAIGVSQGHSIKRGVDNYLYGNFNTEANLAGYQEVMNGSTSVMTEDEADMFISEYMDQLSERLSAENRAKGEKFLAANKRKAGVMETESGLQYKVIKQGEGAAPSYDDYVSVLYTCSTLDGKVVDESTDRDDPAMFWLSNVVHGFAEGVMLMNPGSKYTLWVPADIGYGDGSEEIALGSTLVFEVELLSIDEEGEMNEDYEYGEVDVEEDNPNWPRNVGDYQELIPEHGDIEYGDEDTYIQYNYSYRNHYLLFTDSGMIILDENGNETFNSNTGAENDYNVPSVFEPLAEGAGPIIVMTEPVKDDIRRGELYIIDPATFACKKAGTINVTPTGDDYEYSSIWEAIRINLRGDEIVFTFLPDAMVYDKGGSLQTYMPTSDLYYTYSNKGGLQMKGAATKLSVFAREAAVKEVKTNYPNAQTCFIDVDNDGQKDIIWSETGKTGLNISLLDANCKVRQAIKVMNVDYAFMIPLSSNKIPGKITLHETDHSGEEVKSYTYAFDGTGTLVLEKEEDLGYDEYDYDDYGMIDAAPAVEVVEAR